MAKIPVPAASELPKKTYRVVKNFILKARVYIKGQFAEFHDGEAAAINKYAPGAIALKEAK